MKKKQAIDKIERNKALRTWLKEHDLFNVLALCRRFKYDRGAFARFMEGDLELSEEATDRLENVLAKYGYKL